MRKFITKTILVSCIALISTFMCIMISSYFVKSKGFENETVTVSNTLFFKKNQQYDVLFMGISHARNFSRHNNHIEVANILEANIVNIAQGNGTCGVNEQLFYLDYFYYQGNKTSKLVYVMSPPMLFSETLPYASNTFKQEAFEIPFLYRYLNFSSENKKERIMTYLQYKLSPIWLFKKPKRFKSNVKKLDSLDKTAVEKGQRVAYRGNSLNHIQFKKSAKIVEETIRFSAERNIEVFLVIPPALFGKWKGHQETYDFIKLMKSKYSNVAIFDGSETVLDPNLYYDNHHLNTPGVDYFTKKYLKPLLK
jgi:hypothetical protein